NNHRVVRNNDRRTVADLADRRSFVVEIEFLEEIDDSSLSEGGNGNASLRIQRNQLKTGCSKENPFVTPSVRPICNAAMNFARGLIEAFTLVRPVNPQRLPSTGIGGDHISSLVHGEIEDTIDHDRRRLAARLRVRQKAVGLPDPCDFEVFNIVAVDLVERRVMRTSIL